MNKKGKDLITAADVIASLRQRFSGPAYCFLEQVADGTGARQNRWADAVAMSVWPSRGYDVHGIEVKVSRYDWQIELAQPAKSAAVQQYCNRWWIATPDESIIRTGELPPTWGWMVMNGKGGMRVAADAPILEPRPLSIEFIASVLRNFQRTEESEIESRIQKARNEAREEGNNYYREQYASIKKALEEFEAASGIHVSEYGGGNIGDAVRTLRDLKYRVQHIESAIRAAADIQNMLEKVRALSDLQESIAATVPA